MTASLQVLRGQIGQTSIVLSQTSLRLGRDPTQNNVALPSNDQRISRQHLELVEEFGRWVLIDHSRNGVNVNDELVKGTRRELEHGDRITIGDSVELLFDDPDSTFTAGQASPPPTQPPSAYWHKSLYGYTLSALPLYVHLNGLPIVRL
jgi:pSer/pThr/pTyr-binding forkhead associated (FHA) protein